MWRLIAEKYHIPILAVLTACLIAGAGYFGLRYWSDYQAEKKVRLAQEAEGQAQSEIAKREAEEARLEQERMRDQELEELKAQILALQNKPSDTKTINNTVTMEAKDNVADIVKEWSPRVAHLECSWYLANNIKYAQASGSATLVNFTGLGIRAITNKHILVYNNFAPRECKLTLDDGTFYTIAINKDNVSIGKEEDWAYVALPADETLTNVTKKQVKLCPSVEIGDKLLVLGYPRIGSKTGLTVTEGIVAGIDEEYYITSAKIDKGNSGGAAVLVKDSCYLGIPSASVVGSIESLGRILKSKFVIQ